MTKDMPKETLDSFLSYAAQGRSAWKEGNIERAETSFLAAWAQIPDPKLDYDYAMSFIRGIVEFYRDTAQLDKALEWLPSLRAAYGPEPNPSVEFLAATLYLDKGEHAVAYHMFESLHSEFGKRPFVGNAKYWEAYRKWRSAQ